MKIKKYSNFNESKVSDKVIEIYELLIPKLKEEDILNQDIIESSEIDNIAEDFFNEEKYKEYENFKNYIFDMIKNDYLLKINESQEENIFDEDDEEYDEEHLKRGTEIQREHDPTYKKVKKFIDVVGDMPKKDDFAKSIAKDHMDEPDGVGKLYYDKDDGLEDFEKELKDEWKERQKENDDKEENDKTGKKYDEEEENMIAQKESKIKNFKEVINETGEWEDSDEDSQNWIDYLKKNIEKLIELSEIDIELLDIKGFDKYQGPYANIKIDNDYYKIWTLPYNLFFVENFPINNNKNGEHGFKGRIEDMVEAINSYYKK
jgi:hypothetical protein